MALHDGDTEEPQGLRRSRVPATATADQAGQVATGARWRARIAKQREVEAHARAVELHQSAAELQDGLGHPDRAARAREHAEHLRKLWNQAKEEQAKQA
jgi:hypothetical protein